MPVAARRPGSKRKLRPEIAGGILGARLSVTYELTWRSLTAIGSREAGLPAFSRRSRRATVSTTCVASSQLSPGGALGRTLSPRLAACDQQQRQPEGHEAHRRS